MIEFLQPYISEIITGLVGLLIWLFERNKRKTEFATLTNKLKQQETDTDKSVVDLYQEALDDLKKRYDIKFSDLELDIESLRKNLNLWKGKYTSLKKEFDVYKCKHEKECVK